jgi:hypothetical protein
MWPKIDDFPITRELSFLAFEQYVIAWKCPHGSGRPDPDRAHRNRKASLGQTGLTGKFDVEGPASDHVRLKAMLAHFEEIEFHRDWAVAKAIHGDDVAADKLARTATQRRYDAFQELLRHTTLPTMVDPDLQDGETGETVDIDEAPEPDGPVKMNIVIDAESAVHGLEQLLGISSMAPVRSPFGPDRGFCQTFDGDPIALRDAVLAGLAGKIRIVLRGKDGLPTAMSSARLFTARSGCGVDDATHCTGDA